MLKFQDYFGEPVNSNEVENDLERQLFLMFGNFQHIGELLGLQGKFRINFGLYDIIKAIKELTNDN